MARKDLFSTKTTPKSTNTRNAAGGRAYEMSAKHELAQFAVTGTFGNTFYTSGAAQLEEVKSLLDEIQDPTFLAKLAVYARQSGYMKDMPALILAKVAALDGGLFKSALPQVINNSRMLLTFLQILRSGVTGRKHLSGSCHRALKRHVTTMGPGFFFNATGSAVSIQDALKIIRPKPVERMNLNTALRHGVFEDPKMVKMIAKRISDADEVKKQKVFPFSIYTAWKNTKEVPNSVRNALQDALEAATHNIPHLGDNVVVGCDISGSMSSTVSPMSVVTCYDVAALFAASVLRTHQNATVIPFHQRVEGIGELNGRDSIATNAQKIVNLPSGGTDCAEPLRYILENKILVDTYIVVSDNESWINPRHPGHRYWNGTSTASGTEMMELWNKIKRKNKNARMINIDISPNTSLQSYDRDDILNIGGFSDQVFKVIASFVGGNGSWIDEIEKTSLLGVDKERVFL